jgi:hypothetical protein
MADERKIVARRWATPFDRVDPDRLHLLRVDYPSCAWVQYRDGPHFDFSEFTREGECEITVFCEENRTVYKISAYVDAVWIHDERDMPRIDEWSSDAGNAALRLEGTPLHASLSSIMNSEKPTYCLQTGDDCVESICLGEPLIEAVGKVEDTRPSSH